MALSLTRGIGESIYIGDKELIIKSGVRDNGVYVCYDGETIMIDIGRAYPLDRYIAVWIRRGRADWKFRVSIEAPDDVMILRSELVWEQ